MIPSISPEFGGRASSLSASSSNNEGISAHAAAPYRVGTSSESLGGRLGCTGGTAAYLVDGRPLVSRLGDDFASRARGLSAISLLRPHHLEFETPFWATTCFRGSGRG